MQPQKPKVVSLRTDDEDSPIMNIREVAAYLRISKTQVHKLINGKLPGPVPKVKHIGGRIIFRKAWIDRWLEETSDHQD